MNQNDKGVGTETVNDWYLGVEKMKLEQLQVMNDAELDEAVLSSMNTDNLPNIDWSKFHPTADTVEGRSQAFELMVKYNLRVIPFPSVTEGRHIVNKFSVNSYKDKSLAKAICIAVILNGEKK